MALKGLNQESFQKQAEFDRPGERSPEQDLEQTPLNRSQQLLAPYKRIIDELKQN